MHDGGSLLARAKAKQERGDRSGLLSLNVVVGTILEQKVTVQLFSCFRGVVFEQNLQCCAVVLCVCVVVAVWWRAVDHGRAGWGRSSADVSTHQHHSGSILPSLIISA
jgi:hypothetical protein